jgi:hypothetical protein
LALLALVFHIFADALLSRRLELPPIAQLPNKVSIPNSFQAEPRFLYAISPDEIVNLLNQYPLLQLLFPNKAR